MHVSWLYTSIHISTRLALTLDMRAKSQLARLLSCYYLKCAGRKLLFNSIRVIVVCRHQVANRQRQ